MKNKKKEKETNGLCPYSIHGFEREEKLSSEVKSVDFES